MKNNNFLKSLENVIVGGVSAGLITFIFTYVLVFYWHYDGFNLIEISTCSIIGGLVFMLSIFINNIYFINKYFRVVLAKELIIINRFYLVLISLSIGLVSFLFIDYVFFMIDDSIPSDYAYGLIDIAKKNNSDVSNMADFAKMSFGIQNSIITFLFGLLSSIFSLLFIKKNGRPFKKHSDTLI